MSLQAVSFEKLWRNRFPGVKILFVKIHNALTEYDTNMGVDYDTFVYESARGYWGLNEKDYIRHRHNIENGIIDKDGEIDFGGMPRYVVALDHQRPVGVYKVKEWYKASDTVPSNPKYTIPAYPPQLRANVELPFFFGPKFDNLKLFNRHEVDPYGHPDPILSALYHLLLDHPILLSDDTFKGRWGFRYWISDNSDSRDNDDFFGFCDLPF